LSIPRARARAQEQGKVRRIGFLAPLSRSTPSHPDVFYDAFVQGMRELGYVEGKNLVIVTHSTPATQALQRATSTVPIVFAVAFNPVGSGFAASLARPGGNITGLSVIDVDPSPKRLELLKTMLPALSRVAVLVNPGSSVHPAIVKSVQAAGQHAGIKVLPVDARTPEEIERGFATMSQERAEGVIIADDAFFRGQRQQIADLTVKNRMPAITPWREYVAAGGLMSYGQNIADSFRRAATYVDKILKGAKPGELPIEQPTRIHLAINRKTAKALGLTIPQELLLRADEVIE
jgi:putative ABC transport system substrate-binding protein